MKQNFKEGPKSGPHVARVRSAEVHGLLAQCFPHSPSSVVEVTRLMRLAFPDCESQCDTKGHKETFYIGVEYEMASLASTPTTSLEAHAQIEDDYRQGKGVRVRSSKSVTVTHGTTV